MTGNRFERMKPLHFISRDAVHPDVVEMDIIAWLVFVSLWLFVRVFVLVCVGTLSFSLPRFISMFKCNHIQMWNIELVMRSTCKNNNNVVSKTSSHYSHFVGSRYNINIQRVSRALMRLHFIHCELLDLSLLSERELNGIERGDTAKYV